MESNNKNNAESLIYNVFNLNKVKKNYFMVLFLIFNIILSFAQLPFILDKNIINNSNVIVWYFAIGFFSILLILAVLFICTFISYYYCLLSLKIISFSEIFYLVCIASIPYLLIKPLLIYALYFSRLINNLTLFNSSLSVLFDMQQFPVIYKILNYFDIFLIFSLFILIYFINLVKNKD